MAIKDFVTCVDASLKYTGIPFTFLNFYMKIF